MVGRDLQVLLLDQISARAPISTFWPKYTRNPIPMVATPFTVRF